MISRRSFLTQSTAAAALSIAACQPKKEVPDVIVPSGSKKKGLGMTVKNAAWAERLTDLRCKWFYSWNSNVPPGIPEGINFVPMIYRYGGDPQIIVDTATAAKKAGIKELLGFNEPDVKKQGNMSIEETLDAWPLLMDTGMRLGSPGCVHPDKEWMIEFMAGAKKRNLRVDFVCVHSYGGPSAEGLVKRLEKVYEMFKRPIWITEFAVGDWDAETVQKNRYTPERILGFMQEVLPMLDKLEFVERYAWFPAKPDSAPLGTSALFDENGKLTPLGECYREA